MKKRGSNVWGLFDLLKCSQYKEHHLSTMIIDCEIDFEELTKDFARQSLAKYLV